MQPGPASRVIAKPARLYFSNAIFVEYRDILARPELKIRKGLREQYLQLLKTKAHRVKSTRPLQVTRDPDDNKFLECADAARADYLITGNLPTLSEILEEDEGDFHAGLHFSRSPASHSLNETPELIIAENFAIVMVDCE